MSIIAISGKINSGKDTVGSIIQYLKMKSINEANTQSFEEFCKYNDVKIEDNKQPKKLLPRELISGYGYFEIKKFGGKLKDIVCLLLGCTREQLENEKFKNEELGEYWNKTFWHIQSNHNKCETFFSKEEAEESFSHWDENYEQEVYIASEDVSLTPRIILQLLGTDCGRNIVHPNIWINALMSEYKDGGKFVQEEAYSEQGYYNKQRWESWYPNWIITDMRFHNELTFVKDIEGISIRINREDFEYTPIGEKRVKLPIHSSEIALDNATFDYVIDNNSDINSLIEQVKQILIKEEII